MAKPVPPPPPPAADPVFRPPHYARLVFEPVTISNALGLSYNLGTALKYLLRAGHKEGVAPEQDLQKARRFLEIELECLARHKRVAAGEDPVEVWKAIL